MLGLLISGKFEDQDWTNCKPQKTGPSNTDNGAVENEFDNEVLGFGGQVAHICYFLHIINLVANSLVHELDVNKKWRVESLPGSLMRMQKK